MSSSSANADGSDHRRPSSSSGGPCGACKFLRRKCVEDCIYAPYFSTEQGAAHFSAVHKVFGSNNVSKLLLQIPPHKRLDAAVTICYEAHARLRDPVYGCVASILALQQRVVNLQAEVSFLQAHLTTLEQPSPPPFPPPSYVPMNTDFSIPELSSLSNVPSNVDLSSLFDPSMQLAFQQQHQHQQQLHQVPYGQMGEGSSGIGGANSNSGDLEALARELQDRRLARSTTQKSSHTQF